MNDDIASHTTSIPVMYRDASNYKAWGSITLDGEITAEQIAELRAALADGDSYVPAQIGLPHLAGEEWPGSSYEDDHNWHEMLLDDIEISPAGAAVGRHSWRTPDHAGPVEAFVARVKEAATSGWNPEIGNPWGEASSAG